MSRKPIDDSKLSLTKKSRKGVNEDFDSRREGVFCAPLIEPLPKFVQAGCEKVYGGQNNHYIVMGRDRPRKRSSGYGGKGDHQASMVDIVVGRMAYDVRDNIKTDNNFVKDAARIYISQKADIDDNFNLSQGETEDGNILGVPHSVAKSAIGIKADAVRVLSREGIKLVTKVDDKNSAGDDISADIYGIDLVAGNNADLLQPIPLGDNLLEALITLQKHVQKLNGILYGFMMIQNKFNKALTNHTHINNIAGKLTSTAPVASLVGKQTTVEISQTHIPSLKTNRTNIENFTKNYLSQGGSGYINSAYNKVN